MLGHGQGEARKRVLYLGAGDPAAPSSGMDTVCVAHLHELLGCDRISLEGLVLGPHSGSGDNPQDSAFGSAVALSRGDAPPAGMIAKLQSILTALIFFRPMQYRGFWSRNARRKISGYFSAKFDLILIDHYITTCNVSISSLLSNAVFRRTPVIFVAHNVTSKSMVDAAHLAQSWKERLLFSVQAAQARIREAVILRLATKVVFISSYDREQYRHLDDDRAHILFPLPDGPEAHALPEEVDAESADRAPLISFIGSPRFPPNAEAIAWIDAFLAPELHAIAPEIRIALIGKHTDKLALKSSNVLARGFLSDPEMRALLQQSSAFISPVTFGSGIKIKILDAIAASCPVLATEESLRGFEFMHLSPSLYIDDPKGSAERVAAFICDPAQVAEGKRQIGRNWADFAAKRSGALSRLVLETATAG